MIVDRWGCRLDGAGAEAASRFDAAVEAFALYRGDPVALCDEAAALAPDCAMPVLLKGWLFALATEPEATAAARGILASARVLARDDRARAHAGALELLLAGEWTQAGRALDGWLAVCPRDLPALQAGHLIDFFRADAEGLRDRVARVLQAWEGAPGRSWALGMHAFGLEESGAWAEAEAAGRAAVEEDPRDCWAHHAVAHVFEMAGRPADGAAWIEGRAAHWAGEDNFFRVHNWWHLALCRIETGDMDGAMALYDGPVRGGRSGVAVDLVDASALLWRLDAAGADPGDRWAELSAAWEAQADGRTCAFNDWHAAMAHLGAGREAEAERLLAACRAADRATEAGRWAAEIGAPLIEGFAAFRWGDHARAVETLAGARRIAGAFGGSHAQRDVIDWTLTEAAIRGGMRDTATALARGRLAARPHSPVNKRFLARAQAA